jgi:hypothetical protein
LHLVAQVEAAKVDFLLGEMGDRRQPDNQLPENLDQALTPMTAEAEAEAEADRPVVVEAVLAQATQAAKADTEAHLQ